MRQDNPSLRGITPRTEPEGSPSGVLIIGARRGDVFVATEVLITADTLRDEEAIRAWLAQHEIHVMPPCSTEVIASSGPTGGNCDDG